MDPPALTPFARLADLTDALAATTKRLEKRRLLAEFLRGLRREEVGPAILILTGRIFPESDAKVLNVGWATLQKALGGARQATLSGSSLSILDVRSAFDRIAAASGPDSMRVKKRILESLLGQVTKREQEVLLKSIFGEMRIGANEGVVLEAIADASGADADTVRMAHMFLGDIGRVAELALEEGGAGLAAQSLRLLSPIKPMMADIADSVEEVLAAHGGTTAVEWKFDGARIQIHRDRDRVKVFSRRLTDVTGSVPEVVEAARALPATSFLLEGEAVAVDDAGRPRPFQEIMRRFRRVHDIAALRREIPLKLYLFDLLSLDGTNYVARPYRERWDALSRLVPSALLANRIVTSSAAEIEAFQREAFDAGHEGLMAKALESTYTPGKRGKKWFKLKPAETLDVAILAAEWGHGRRTGTLSNYWLGVRDGARWQMIGKTFKGLTDLERLELMDRLLGLKTSEDTWVVHVRPDVVVEVAYNEIQRSPHYESGFALRFARVTRVRDDKGPREAETYERLRALYARQFERKGKVVEV